MGRIQARCEEFGGHTHAVGLEFEAPRLAEIARLWAEDVGSLRPVDATVPVDMEIALAELSPSFLREVRMIEPFGPGNREPIFVSRNLLVQSIVRQERGCRRFWVRSGTAVMECRVPSERDSSVIVPGAIVDLHYTAGLCGESAGLERIRLEVVGCTVSGSNLA